MHGLGGPIRSEPTRPLWARASGTLESIVHQATHCHNPKPNLVTHNQNPVNEIGASNGGKRLMENTCVLQMGLNPMNKRSRSESSPNGKHSSSMNVHNLCADRSTCASASATFCREIDTTMVSTWTSATATCSLKTKNRDEDSAFHCRSVNNGVNSDVDKKQEIKAEAGQQSHSARRSRIASVHNQSERRRRDKINQKIKALQKLVPNSSKTDKASMLEEVIEYLKRLQAQLHEMISFRTTPMHQSSHQLMMMMPAAAAAAMAIQRQQLQMSLLASMGGMGLGMGMLDMNPAAACATAPQDIQYPNPAATSTRTPFVQPPFVMMPPLMHTHSASASAASSHHIHSRHSNSYA